MEENRDLKEELFIAKGISKKDTSSEVDLPLLYRKIANLHQAL